MYKVGNYRVFPSGVITYQSTTFYDGGLVNDQDDTDISIGLNYDLTDTVDVHAVYDAETEVYSIGVRAYINRTGLRYKKQDS